MEVALLSGGHHGAGWLSPFRTEGTLCPPASHGEAHRALSLFMFGSAFWNLLRLCLGAQHHPGVQVSAGSSCVPRTPPPLPCTPGSVDRVLRFVSGRSTHRPPLTSKHVFVGGAIEPPHGATCGAACHLLTALPRCTRLCLGMMLRLVQGLFDFCSLGPRFPGFCGGTCHFRDQLTSPSHI